MPNLIGTNANQVSTNGMLGTAAFLDITPAEEFATGTAIASAATINLDTATGNRVHITGTTTITAVTLTRGPRTVIFDGVLTLTHNATANNLPGAVNIITAVGDRAIYESDGAAVYCVAYTRSNGLGVVSASAGDHEIALHTGNGHGTTNTVIRRFTTAMNNTGTAITYADSATLGATLTINETGLYSIYYSDVTGSATRQFGVSVNSSQLTIAIDLIAVANRLAFTTNPAVDVITSLSRVVRLTAGDVIRPHTAGSHTYASNAVFFAIRKVGI